MRRASHARKGRFFRARHEEPNGGEAPDLSVAAHGLDLVRLEDVHAEMRGDGGEGHARAGWRRIGGWRAGPRGA